MHIKIKKEFERMIDEIIQEESGKFGKLTPSMIVHGILKKVKDERESDTLYRESEDNDNYEVDD